MSRTISKYDKKCDKCSLCKKLRILTKHHLFPRCHHKQQEYIALYGGSKMRRSKIFVCSFCHIGIHSVFSTKQLVEKFNTLQSILSDEKIKKYIEYSKTQKQYDISQEQTNKLNRKAKEKARCKAKKKARMKIEKRKISKQQKLIKVE